MEKELEESLDRSIDHHYQDICFNPNKKDTLRRLTQQSRLYNQTIDQSIHTKQPLSLEVDNNHSINLYIQHVYHKYHLEDPLNKCYRNRQTEDTRDVTLINTPFKQTEKIQETTKTTKSQKITSTKKKLLEMRQNYKKDCSDVISSVFFPAQLTHRETEGNGMRQSRIAKQIGYRTRQRIHFKTHTNEDISSFQSTFQLELPIKTVRTSNLKVRFNYNPQQQQKTRKQRAVSEVQVSFRYCPMCEEIILHENIAYHQTNCKQIQEAYKLPLNQLQKEITAKIHRMKNEIEGELQSYTDQKILKEYHNLSRSLMQWLNKQDEQSFEKVRGGYQQMALRQFDLIGKLRWFQNLHQTIRREIKSTSI